MYFDLVIWMAFGIFIHQPDLLFIQRQNIMLELTKKSLKLGKILTGIDHINLQYPLLSCI